MNNTYCKILNEIASVFDMDQWDEQVNLFTDIINKRLNPFIHNTEHTYIYILENGSCNFPQYNFYKDRCYVNGEKIELDGVWGTTENKWKDREIVNVIIKDLDQLDKSCTYMFLGCESLVSVPEFNTSRVTDMEGMFWGCESLKSVPLFDISDVTDIDDMFYACPSLSEETKNVWGSIYNFETNKKK